MKVRITKTVSSFLYNGVDYKPGDIVEIPESLFQSHFMVDLDAKPQPTPKAQAPAAPLVSGNTFSDTLPEGISITTNYSDEVEAAPDEPVVDEAPKAKKRRRASS